MEEEAIVATVGAVPGTSIGKSLELEFVNVIFRALRSAEYQGKVCKATIKEPAWLSKLEPSARWTAIYLSTVNSPPVSPKTIAS